MPLSRAGKAVAAAFAAGSFGAVEPGPPHLPGQTVFLERQSSPVARR